DVPRAQAARAARRRTSVHGRRRHRRRREARALHAVLRRARARDLLPCGHARLLPLAHLRQRPGLLGRLRIARRDGAQHAAGAPRARRAAARERALAALPPGHARGEAAHGSVYAAGAMRRREHLAGLLLGLAFAVLGGRALAYAATPTPLAGELGGP